MASTIASHKINNTAHGINNIAPHGINNIAETTSHRVAIGWHRKTSSRHNGGDRPPREETSQPASRKAAKKKEKEKKAQKKKNLRASIIYAHAKDRRTRRAGEHMQAGEEQASGALLSVLRAKKGRQEEALDSTSEKVQPVGHGQGTTITAIRLKLGYTKPCGRSVHLR